MLNLKSFIEGFEHVYGNEDTQVSSRRFLNESWTDENGSDEYKEYRDDCTFNIDLPSDVEIYLDEYLTPGRAYGQLPSGVVFWETEDQVVYFNNVEELISEVRYDIKEEADVILSDEEAYNVSPEYQAVLRNTLEEEYKLYINDELAEVSDDLDELKGGFFDSEAVEIWDDEEGVLVYEKPAYEDEQDYSRTLRPFGFVQESYDEDPEVNSTVEKLISVINQNGFELDDSLGHENPNLNYFGDGYHFQIINKNHQYGVDTITDEEWSNIFDAEVKPLVDAIEIIEDYPSIIITWNFGMNREGFITAGLDLRMKALFKKAKARFSEAVERGDYYFYNMNDPVIRAHDERVEYQNLGYDYFTDEEIDRIKVYRATDELIAKWENDELSNLWPVHDIDGWSTEFAPCSSPQDARSKVGLSLNYSIYEYVNDL